MHMRLNQLMLAVALVIGAAPPAIAGVADAPPVDPLDAVDCATLRVDFVHFMPEIVAPQKLVIPNPPFDQAALAAMNRAADQDPNGLCHYRDANRALPKATAKRVIFYGDSITEYWPLAAPDLFRNDVVGCGVSAQNTTQMLARFRRDVLDLKPRVVHILAGVNDPMSAGGMLSTRTNIMAMVDLARTHGVKVVLATLTPSTGFWLAPGVKLAPQIAAHNAWLRRYAAHERIALIDYHAALAGADGALGENLSNDGLHPNRLGYALMTPLARKAIAVAQGQ